MPSVQRDEVFISYSHRDSKWLDRIQILLRPLTRSGAVKVWADTSIKPGANWESEISNALTRAKVAVLLVSPDFLASEFIANNELPPLLTAAQTDGLTVLWIPIRSSLYKETPIAKYQAAHDPSKPLASLKAAAADDALVKIAAGIRAALSPVP